MPEFVNKIKKTLLNKKVFCDVGADKAFYSEIAVETMSPKSKVFMFEPKFGKNYENIISQGAEKDIEVIVSDVAVSNVNGSDKITKDTLCKNINYKNEMRRTPPREVNTVTLDSFFEDKKEHPDVIKIDTEGWEVNILEGAKKIIKKNNTHFFIEVHWEYLRLQDQDGKQVLEFFDKENYEVDLIKFHNGKPFAERLGKKNIEKQHYHIITYIQKLRHTIK